MQNNKAESKELRSEMQRLISVVSIGTLAIILAIVGHGLLVAASL